MVKTEINSEIIIFFILTLAALIIIIIIFTIIIIITIFFVPWIVNIPRVKNVKLKPDLEWSTFGVMPIDEGASESNLIETLY